MKNESICVVERPTNRLVQKCCNEAAACILAAALQSAPHKPEIYFATYTEQESHNLSSTGLTGNKIDYTPHDDSNVNFFGDGQ